MYMLNRLVRFRYLRLPVDLRNERKVMEPIRLYSVILYNDMPLIGNVSVRFPTFFGS